MRGLPSCCRRCLAWAGWLAAAQRARARRAPAAACTLAGWRRARHAGQRDEHPRRYALVAALPRRGHKLVSLDSDDDAFDGDSDEEEVAVQLAAQRRQTLAESLSAAEPKPPRATCLDLLLA